MPEVGVNPFQPGRGILPPLVAGRERELEIAEGRLGDLAGGRSPARDLLFYGPRGNGKTTLLPEIRRRGEERGIRVERLPVYALTDPARLVRILRERAPTHEGVSPGVRTAESGVSAAPISAPDDPGVLLAGWVGRNENRPLVILLDEVQVLDPGTARPFFEAVPEVKSRAAPFLVIAAGTPDAPRRIRQAGTLDERGFEQCRIGRLERPATLAALREPARASGRPFTEAAAGFLAEQSQDYPYFVQLLGRAAWKAAAEGAVEISLREAQRGDAGCSEDIEALFEGRYQEAREHRIEPVLAPLASLVSEHGGEITDSQLKPLLRHFGAEPEVPFDDLSLRDELSDLGVLWPVRPGVWEMGIPGFADYLLRRG